MPRLPAAVSSLLAALYLVATTSVASPPVVRIITTDLKPLIRAAAPSPSQFAVHVPESVSIRTAGTWSVVGDRATWQYAVRIPTAVSLSFHASPASLPPGAVLMVRGNSSTVAYRADDLHKGELWSRIQPGDTLEFTLTVPSTERKQVLLEIVSFQAGYRALGAGVADHPIYQRMKVQGLAGTNSSCVQNYECSVTPANTPAAQATVGLVIGNLYQCSGTLINDVPGDNAPFILTARHCQSGHLGGGVPNAASTLTVYWDAITPCGSTLGALYDPSIARQAGATTVVEQEDAWLVRLDLSPIVADAQFAGFDVSNGSVQGGYTVHHAIGYDKQLTRWFQQAAAVQLPNVLGVTYLSHFWETVNQSGNIGPGASGSGLFDQNDHLVGSLSLGRKSYDGSGYESCPLTSPLAPDGTNGAADFTSLAAVWNSTADTTSSTGGTTLRSVLDPASTGTSVVASAPAAHATFTASSYGLAVGGSDQLTWSVPSASTCTASGGTSGDGWSGTLPGSGTQMVTENVASVVGYILTCQLSGGRTVNVSVAVNWGTSTIQANISASAYVWTTRPATISWVSNASPCSITGGALTLTNLPSTGSTTTTQATAGDVQYGITCGTAIGIINAATVHFVTPNLVFQTNGTDRQLGHPFFLQWFSYADSCAPSGGAPNDGWTTTAFGVPGAFPQFSPNVTTSGTYTYTITCSSGPISLQKSIDVTFENNPGYVTASVDKTSTIFSNTPADYFTFSWISNLDLCAVSIDGTPASITNHGYPTDTGIFAPSAPGTYVFTVTCNSYNTAVGAVTSAPITVTVTAPPPPTVTLSITPATVSVGQNYTVNWTANYASACTGTIAGTGTTWDPGYVAGPLTFTAATPGQYTYNISCQGVTGVKPDGTAQATLIINGPAPTVTLTATPSALTKGASLSLSWSSTNASSCSASGGGADGSPWSGSLQTSGTQSQTTTTAGTFTYTVTCLSGSQSVQSQAAVTVSAPTTGGGGGGPFGVLGLGSLAIAWRLRRRS